MKDAGIVYRDRDDRITQFHFSLREGEFDLPLVDGLTAREEVAARPIATLAPFDELRDAGQGMTHRALFIHQRRLAHHAGAPRFTR